MMHIHFFKTYNIVVVSLKIPMSNLLKCQNPITENFKFKLIKPSKLSRISLLLCI